MSIAISIGMFAVGLACVFHMIALIGDEGAFMARRFLTTYAFYGAGVVFYVWHIPERWSPGSFDFMVRGGSK